MDVSKQTINYHDCKVSCHRLDREIFRICPTKLSKRELEELYYELTDANICLKKTINSQKEKIKMLSTKLLRMTAVQRVYTNNDNSCCSNIKLTVEEQKNCISELKRANDRLAEKVRQMNTKLCSAKQFLKKSPYHSTPRSKKTLSLKQSASSLNTKQSEINVRDPLQNHDSEMPSPILAESTHRTNRHEISIVKEEISSKKPLENIKYSSEIEDLKLIISKLQTQLAEITQENSNQLSYIENQLSKLKEENLQLRAERNDLRNTLKSKSDEYRKCNMKLMYLETQCNNLTVELTLSKRRVSEMETRTKSAELSDQLSKTIEQHLANEAQKKNQLMITKEFDYRDGHHTKGEKSSSQKVDTSTSPRKETSKENASKCTKNDKADQKLEDSGFNEPVGNATTTDDGKELLRLNQELIKKLTHLQNQLDSLQSSTIKPEQIKSNQDNTLKETLQSNSKQPITDRNNEDDDISEDIEATNTGFRHSTPIKTDSKPIRNIEDENTEHYSDEFEESNKESVRSENSVKSMNRKTEISSEHKRTPHKIASKSDINKDDIPKAADPKPQVQKAKAEKVKSIQRNLLNTETYSVRKSVKNKDSKVIKKHLSSDDTENDVSSFTSVEDDDKRTRYRLSLGERRLSSGYSEADSPCTSADLDCLSEGEILLGQRLSVGESPYYRPRTMPRTTKEEVQPLSKSIEGTLQAITKELNLCGKLLNFQPSAEVPRYKRSN